MDIQLSNSTGRIGSQTEKRCKDQLLLSLSLFLFSLVGYVAIIFFTVYMMKMHY